MLYVANGQFGIFLAFMWLGALLGVFYQIIKCDNKAKNLCDFLFLTISGGLFIIFMHIFNLGKFRLYLIIGLLLGLLIEKIFVSKTRAQGKNLLYNIIITKIKKMKLAFNEKHKAQRIKLNKKTSLKIKNKKQRKT